LCFPFAAPALGGGALPEAFDETFEDEELVYTTKVVYHFNDNINAYASFTHGFKAGGFNLDATAAVGGADPSFDSEVIDAYEIGVKSEWFDRRLRANLTIFDYDIEDFQLLEFTGVQFQTFNVPNAETTGAELEIFARPLPGLEFNLGYTYSDARYPNDCDDNQPNAPIQVSSLCGNDLTNAPENVVTFGASYDGYINERLAWFAHANLRWEDDRRTSTGTNLPLDVQGPNTKINVRFGIGAPDGRWQAELWSNNVTDEITRNVTFNTPLRGLSAIGTQSRAAFLEAPRTWGLTLRTAL